eukprot:CAMPEP_0179221902 /NCGR_PEP_ID=MMETSP0797-20121207/6437_1 /TAXON_ID=47934 /ORGANISM="Dinophysis acuminata, Strain DAEP01" /LENGTH=392 /DNA_ID=CAMNT_0020928713 /DNA_START=59 /DNA_END=1237 /DNA_ORIENTATION=+
MTDYSRTPERPLYAGAPHTSPAVVEIEPFQAETKQRDDVNGNAFLQQLLACRSASLKLLVLVSLWWAVAIVVTLLMKNTVRGGGIYPYPFALTGLTNTCTGLLAFVLSCVVHFHASPLPAMEAHEVAKLAMIGAIQGAEIGCTNKSLEFLNVSTRTMVSSMSVLFMMLTARIWGLEQLGALRFVVAALLTLGGALQGLDLTGFGAAPSQMSPGCWRGLALMVSSMVLGSHRWALIQHITQHSPPQSAVGLMANSKLQLVARTMPLTGIVCFALAGYFERGALALDPLLQSALLANVLGISAGIATLTVVELEIVRVTSAVALQVLGTLKEIPVAVAGVLFFREQVGALSTIGFAFCVLGALVYKNLRSAEAAAPPAHLPHMQPLRGDLGSPD